MIEIMYHFNFINSEKVNIADVNVISRTRQEKNSNSSNKVSWVASLQSTLTGVNGFRLSTKKQIHMIFLSTRFQEPTGYNQQLEDTAALMTFLRTKNVGKILDVSMNWTSFCV
jgi:hypothetical protein